MDGSNPIPAEPILSYFEDPRQPTGRFCRFCGPHSLKSRDVADLECCGFRFRFETVSNSECRLLIQCPGGRMLGEPSSKDGDPTMFVATRDGWIALRSIRNVHRSKEDVTIYYGEDESSRTSLTIWELALQTAGQMIPATPGTYLLHEVLGSDSFDYIKANVIAWTMSGEGHFLPVAAGGINDGVTDQPAILFPDGRVEMPDVRSYETLQEWEEDRRDEVGS